MSSLLGLAAPSNLPELVRSTFQKARDSAQLLFTPTQVAILRANSINSIAFQLRFAPSLAKKPLPKKPLPTTNATPPIDPFADPIPPALFVADIAPHHRLVLNKFPVTPEHSILATASFEPQDHLLAARDLAATRACVLAYRAAGRRLFAFFNSGPHSGASQPHRHIQLLPVDGMCEGLPAGADDGGSSSGSRGWDVLADTLADRASGSRTAATGLPFKAFAERLKDGIGSEELHQAYLGLYRRACREIEALGGIQEDGYNTQTEGEARISYNLAMTEGVMVMCPRTEGEATMRLGGAGDHDAVCVSLNGTVLAGTALVKRQEDFDFLCAEPGRLMEMLGQIGVPNTMSQQEDQ